MPSGRSGGGSSHFGGGSRSFGGSSHFGGSRSFGGSSHFGRSRSSGGSSHFGGSHSFRPRLHWRPHTTVVFGRPVYFGAGRSTAVSLLSIFIVIAVIATMLLGASWYSCEQDLAVINDNYVYYKNMAENAGYSKQCLGTVTDIEQYQSTGKYRVLYKFNTYSYGSVEGYSFYVYNYPDAKKILDEGTIVLALDTDASSASYITDSVPLSYKDTSLKDDGEYLEYYGECIRQRALTFVAGGVAVALVVASLILSVTAKKATKEQLAENGEAKDTSKEGVDMAAKTSINGWRCEYCNSLNDNDKNTCDGCGAGRQK